MNFSHKNMYHLLTKLSLFYTEPQSISQQHPKSQNDVVISQWHFKLIYEPDKE